MYSKYLVFVILILSVSLLNAQQIRITRTDVEPIRFGFATATLKIGFDIYIDNIQNAKGVTFTLEHTKQDVILFSGYSNGDFPEKGTVVTNTPFPSKSSLSVAALSGLQTSDPGVDTPFAVHLEFVVSPTAKHLDVATFTFKNIRAIVGPDSLVIIQDSIVDITINGFINVYPGDANFDGIVNSLDYAEIAFYTGAGSANSTVRGYKRKSASAIWQPQQALSWDSAAVTDVDCDGSGDINLSDLLVIATNIEKRHTDRTRRTLLGILQPIEFKKDLEKSYSSCEIVSTFIVPNFYQPIIGVLSKSYSEIEISNISTNSNFPFFSHNAKHSFFLGRIDHSVINDFRNNRIDLCSKNNIQNLDVVFLLADGTTVEDVLLPITTSVDELGSVVVSRNNESNIILKNLPHQSIVSVYSLLGQELFTKEYSFLNTSEIEIIIPSKTPLLVRVYSQNKSTFQSFLVP